MNQKVIAITLLLIVCLLYFLPVQAIEQDARLHIYCPHLAYRNKLLKLWKKTYPEAKDALVFVLEKKNADLCWLSSMELAKEETKYQDIKQSYGYDPPKQIVQPKMTPVSVVGYVFFYREKTLDASNVFSSFENIFAHQLRYYHNHTPPYIAPFFLSKEREEDNLHAYIHRYQSLLLEGDIQDDMFHKAQAYVTYDCGLYPSWQSIKNQPSDLHFSTMPTYQHEQLYLPCILYGFCVKKKSSFPKATTAFLNLVRSQEGLQAWLDDGKGLAFVKKDDVKDFYVYEHAKKEMMIAFNQALLFDPTTLDSFFAASIQNYICSYQTKHQ